MLNPEDGQPTYFAHSRWNDQSKLSTHSMLLPWLLLWLDHPGHLSPFTWLQLQRQSHHIKSTQRSCLLKSFMQFEVPCTWHRRNGSLLSDPPLILPGMWLARWD
jgi:hypothetical protein